MQPGISQPRFSICGALSANSGDCGFKVILGIILIINNPVIQNIYKAMKRADLIKARLQESLKPQHLELVNESARHRGHAGDDDSGESHFKLIVVSSHFEGMN